MLNAKTKLYGIFGNPVRHSFSPLMHNPAFEAVGLNAAYLAFEVEDLKTAVSAIKALGIGGVSVTIPHKVEVMDYLDEIDNLARHIGAVNSVVNREGILHGTNTDAFGFYKALSDVTEIDGKTVAILGNGGAARAALFSLFHYAEPKKVFLFCRGESLGKAESLATHLTAYGVDSGKIQPMVYDAWRDVQNQVEIICNTTSVGMEPSSNVSLLNVAEIPNDSVVFDIVYRPHETALLQNAVTAGAKVVHGIEMLLYQGVKQFELFTGKDAPVEVMRKALIDALH